MAVIVLNNIWYINHITISVHTSNLCGEFHRKQSLGFSIELLHSVGIMVGMATVEKKSVEKGNVT